MSTKSANQNVIAALLVGLLALAGLNIYQFINRNSLVETNKQQESELIEMEKTKTELEKEYYEALSELEEMKGSNAELNEMIEGQKEELTKQKDRISSLLRDSKNLKSAREEIQKMREQGEQYLAEITVLREENEKLLASNDQLSQQNTSLQSEVESQRTVNEELNTEREILSKANEELTSTTENLTKKVNMASTVEVNDIEVKGYRISDDGKSSRKRRAENVDMIRICFETTINELATDNEEEFIIRVIDPIGETLAIEKMGSGIANVGIDNQQIRYTRTISTEYNQEEKEVCAEWAPSVDFRKGLYTVEIYNKGFLAGTSEFKLR